MESNTQPLTLQDIEHRFAEIKRRITGRDLKENTIKNNARMIAKIMAATGGIPIWLYPDKVEEHLDNSKLSLTTKRNYTSLMLAMVNYEKQIAENNQVDDAIKRYVSLIAEAEKQVATNKQERVVSAKKQEQQVMPSVVYDIVDGLNANKHHNLALIVEILMKYPYRAEVGTLIYYTLEDFNKLKHKTENYLVVGKRKIFVSRSDYKTSHKYGTIKNDIKEPDLKKKIREYIEMNDVESANSMFGFATAQDLSKRLGYITKKMTGISLGPAAIVKVMLSNHKFKDMASAADYLREASRVRGTSLSVLQDVYLHKSALED